MLKLVENVCGGCLPVEALAAIKQERLNSTKPAAKTEPVKGKRAKFCVRRSGHIFGEVAEKPDPRHLAEQLLEQFSAIDEEKPVLQIGDARVTAGWLVERAKEIAAAFLKRKLRRGDVVILAIDFDQDAIALILGILLAGGCIAPINPGQKAPMVAHSMLETACRYMVTDEKYAVEIEDAVMTTIMHHQFMFDQLFIRGRPADGKDPMQAARSENIRPYTDLSDTDSSEYEKVDRERPDRDPNKVEPVFMCGTDATGDSAVHLSSMIRKLTPVFGSAAISAQLEQFKLLFEHDVLDFGSQKFVLGMSLLTHAGLVSLFAGMLYASGGVVLPTPEQFNESHRLLPELLPRLALDTFSTGVIIPAPILFDLASTATKSNIGSLKKVICFSTLSSGVLCRVAARLEARWPIVSVTALCGSPEVGIVGVCPRPALDSGYMSLFPWTEAKTVQLEALTDEDKHEGTGAVPVGKFGRIGMRGPQTMTSFANDGDGTAAIMFDMKYQFFRLAEQAGVLRATGEVILGDLDEDDADAVALFNDEDVKDGIAIGAEEPTTTREPSESTTPGFAGIAPPIQSGPKNAVYRFVSFAKREGRSEQDERMLAAERGYFKVTEVPRCPVYGSLKRAEVHHMANMLADPQ